MIQSFGFNIPGTPKVEYTILNFFFTNISFSLQQFVKGGVVHLQHASNLEDASARKVMLAKNAARKWNTNVSDIVWKVVPQEIVPALNMENHVKKVNIVYKSEFKLKTKVFKLEFTMLLVLFSWERFNVKEKKIHLIFSFENHSFKSSIIFMILSILGINVQCLSKKKTNSFTCCKYREKNSNLFYSIMDTQK